MLPSLTFRSILFLLILFTLITSPTFTKATSLPSHIHPIPIRHFRHLLTTNPLTRNLNLANKSDDEEDDGENEDDDDEEDDIPGRPPAVSSDRRAPAVKKQPRRAKSSPSAPANPAATPAAATTPSSATSPSTSTSPAAAVATSAAAATPVATPAVATPATAATPAAAATAVSASTPAAATTPAGTSASTPASTAEEDTAFRAFRLAHRRETHDGRGDPFDDQPIFENGTLAATFSKNPTTSSLDAISGASDIDWYSEADYFDRIDFRFTFAQDSSAYAITKPTISVSPGSGIDPQIVGFSVDTESANGMFTIMYRCRPAGTKKNFIAMHLPITRGHSVDTVWIKTCGSGHFHHLVVGFKSQNSDIIEFNPDGSMGEAERRKLEVGPMDPSTQFSMRLKPPAENLEFGRPFLESTSSDFSVHLRGTVAAGTFSGDTDTSFTVMYDCNKRTTVEVRLSIAIPPWDNVTIDWRKDCGGRPPQALVIGSSGKDSYNIMHNGELAAGFNVSENEKVADVDGRVSEVPAAITSSRFYISNDDTTSDIHIQTISLTISNPDVLESFVGVPRMGRGSSYLASNGGVVRRQDMKILLLHYVCKKAGRSLVLVTLPVVQYKNVEFGFLKVCEKPHAYYHNGFMTAGSLMLTIFAVVIGLLIGACWCMARRRRGIKYSAVSTSEA